MPAIYLLIDSEGLPRYIGQTASPKTRSCDHRADKEWVAGFFILQWCSQTSVRRLEGEWIAYFRTLGFPLENRNNGGSGLRPGCRSNTLGFKHSEETKRRMSQQRRGVSKPGTIAAHLGSKHSTETKAKMAASKSDKHKCSEASKRGWIKRRQNQEVTA